MSLDFEVIGPYRVTGLLGRGGMGTVYSGIHAKNEQQVAIKVLSSSLAQHARFRRRFDAEIQTLLRLKHPNIVQLIGFGEEKGLLFYSMELVEGENLHQLLKRESTVSWSQSMDWAIEICDALKHAHTLASLNSTAPPKPPWLAPFSERPILCLPNKPKEKAFRYEATCIRSERSVTHALQVAHLLPVRASRKSCSMFGTGI